LLENPITVSRGSRALLPKGEQAVVDLAEPRRPRRLVWAAERSSAFTDL